MKFYLLKKKYKKNAIEENRKESIFLKVLKKNKQNKKKFIKKMIIRLIYGYKKINK